MSRVYTFNMDNFAKIVITDLDNNGILKILTARDYSTQKSVLEKLDKNGVKIAQPTFSNKISRNGLKVSELQMICELYNFDLALCPKENK